MLPIQFLRGVCTTCGALIYSQPCTNCFCNSRASDMALHDTMRDVLPNVFFAVVGLLATYLLYNIFFHPLASIPGPFLGRFCACDSINGWHSLRHIISRAMEGSAHVERRLLQRSGSVAFQTWTASAHSTKRSQHSRRRCRSAYLWSRLKVCSC